MLSKAKLPEKFLGEVINTSTFLQNRLPTKSNDTKPNEFFSKNKQNLSLLNISGCSVSAYVNKNKKGKFHYKAEQGIFVGYDKRIKGYRIYIDGNNVMK